jgi:hypothetical protein
MMRETCDLTVFCDKFSSLAMTLFGRPRNKVAKTCRSRCVNSTLVFLGIAHISGATSLIGIAGCNAKMFSDEMGAQFGQSTTTARGK